MSSIHGREFFSLHKLLRRLVYIVRPFFSSLETLSYSFRSLIVATFKVSIQSELLFPSLGFYLDSLISLQNRFQDVVG